MPRNTFFLIAALILTTVILSAIAIYSLIAPATSQAPKSATVSRPVSPSPTQMIYPVKMTFSENELSVLPGQQEKLGVILDTHNVPYTGVQLDIAYDKSLLTNVSITPGTFGNVPLFVDNKASTVSGVMTLSFGIEPQGKPLEGIAQIATITFTAKSGVEKTGRIDILPSSIVILGNNQTARTDITTSVEITVGVSKKTASPSSTLH